MSPKKEISDKNRLNKSTDEIKKAYARRDTSGKQSLYAWHLPENQLMRYRLHCVVAEMLGNEGWRDLSRKHCLDVGCGTGGWLRTLLEWGCDVSNLHGLDLLPDRIERAREISPPPPRFSSFRCLAYALC